MLCFNAINMNKGIKLHITQCISIFCIILKISHGARILGVFSVPSVSHQIVFRALMEELAKRGHHLVVVTTDPVQYKEEDFRNLTQIDVHDISYKMWTDHFNFADQKLKDTGSLSVLKSFYKIMLDIADAQLDIPEIKNIISTPEERFDLVIVESIVPVMSAFKDRFNCPLILMCSFTGFLQNFDAFGLPSHPLLYADIFSPYNVGNLNRFQKFHLVYQDLYYKYLYYWKFLPKMNELAKRHFGSNVRPLDVIENNADMMFLNFHPIFGGVRPLVPAVIHMGSMHIKPTKPLPPALKKMLDDSKQGVVYFSLGSNVKSKHLPVEIRKIFLNAFREIPYTVLWKWEDDTLPDQPSNVVISKWFPQQDVLAHPNIRAFIFQGGQQSMEEAIHFGVPLIGIPFMGDQPLNVEKMVKLGFGIGLSIETITVQKVRNAVTEIIENSSYKSNITKLRELLYDQPQTSLERAVWWTEYVLRHGGARHLRSIAADTPAYEYFMLDLLAAALAGVAAAVLSIAVIARFLLRFCEVNKVGRKLKAT